ncbi:hypothetical protein JAAARDRAFT_187846 [Jaapia argillacea MUCL 33604]|uniref:STB6-like N-terminal domain-containing protein n=1 Tax=Jaapia argillacea MUCL 33604 TaxID=933084 RepID=A0A067QBT1_9AGAM|nr:hypothetical protein JAAARDRAFT_187846 [Jaapia argillacea MUCL 33604]
MSRPSNQSRATSYPAVQPLSSSSQPNAQPPHVSFSRSSTTPQLSHYPSFSATSATMSAAVVDVRAKRLLMPTVRVPRLGPAPSPSNTITPNIPVGASPRSKHKHSGSRIIRSRSGSTSVLALPEPVPQVPEFAGEEWLGPNHKFDVVQEQLEIEGYQLYAVEKWIVERTRPVTVLTVYTGNPEHKITVTALSISTSLTGHDARQEWDKALHSLRRDGARPKDTDIGTLMVTSLANFRSDFTIVHIPTGNFLEIREQLYTNINLLRMGCSGRSALTLEEPSDTTKDRFISMYHFNDKIREPEIFNLTVLELVKLIQTGLSFFGMFTTSLEDKNGLLCDVTVDGIQKWVTEIGEPFAKVEPMERVADPTVVSALLSLVLAVRNKLYATGYSHVVPKDPFLDPGGFLTALSHFQQSRTHTLQPTTVVSTAPPAPYLTRELLESIDRAYEKGRSSDSYKVHRVILSKLDDLTMDLSASGSAAVGVEPTLDITRFVKCVMGGEKKDGARSLRCLWTGRVGDLLEMKRRGKGGIGSDVEKVEDGEKGGDDRPEGKVTDSEGEVFGPMLWSGKVQKKIENWAIRTRKKTSVDFGRGRPPQVGDGSTPSSLHQHQRQPSQVPSVIVSGDPDDEEILSSGQASPTCNLFPPFTLSPFLIVHKAESRTPNPFLLSAGKLSLGELSSISNISMSDYDRRVTEFNQKRPSTKPCYQSRIVSWSDPVSARGILDDEPDEDDKKDEDEKEYERLREQERLRRRVRGRRLTRVSEDGEYFLDNSSPNSAAASPTRKPGRRIKRSYSLDDISRLKDLRVLPIDWMRIDVELAGQALIMRRRERHLENVVACLQALTQSLSSTNSSLRQEYDSHQLAIKDVESHIEVVAAIENERAKADAMMQETQALRYESAQFRVPELWHMSTPPRQKVIQLREKVFGTGGRRLRPGEHDAHGPFNRLQWTLDGEERLVDRFGRTESEVEEEKGFPAEFPVHDEEGTDDLEPEYLSGPTWLLQLFNSWGNRWGLFTAKPKPNEPNAIGTQLITPTATSPASSSDSHPPS